VGGVSLKTFCLMERVLEWTARGSDGSKIKNHSATVIGHHMYVFGGYDGQNNYNKIHIFDCQANRWHFGLAEGDHPSGRNGHTATYAHGHIFMLGGWLGCGPFAASELMALRVDGLTWVKPLIPEGEGPGPCNMHTVS